ncbi:MAG: NFACT family protein, partial [Cyclobacteriaceae bacterium]|nr:NFACT family protein [Cyclobacteriaceae bacterium]
MHNNYYFLKHLCHALEQKILDHELSEVFSQNKDELILGFSTSHDTYYIKAHLQADFCCLYFTEEFHRSRKNSINLFKNAIHNKVIGIRQYKNERSFSIVLDNNFTLLFKMHGNRSNIILFQENKTEALFKNSLKQDHDINIHKLDREIDQRFDAFLQHDSSHKKLFPTFGKIPIQYLVKNNYDSLDENEKWALIQKLLSELHKKTFYIVNENNTIHLSLLKKENSIYETHSPIEAINYFYLHFIRTSQLNKEKKEALKYIEKKVKKTENYIIKTSKKLKEITESTNYEILANIIMANLHQIPKHSSQVSLTNFYTDSEISIKLKPNISPQKNAENYYRKSKNQKIEIQSLKEAISKKKKESVLYNEQLHVISSSEDTTLLRKFVK